MKRTVTFYSPGTFMPEISSKKLSARSYQGLVEKAVKEAVNIVERHNAVPYGFRIEGQDGMFYLPHMEKHFAKDISNTPDNEILKWNCEANGFDIYVQSTSGWKSTHPFGKDDKLIREELVNGLSQYTVDMPWLHTWNP